MTQPLFLVGPRGCGKTTVGQGLAASLGFQFTDTDRWLFDHTGETVAEIVDKEGWPGFRARESQALQAVTTPATVIATGGGMVLDEANRHFMRQHGQVIYLQVPAATLVERLLASPEEEQRPTLTGKPMVEEIEDVLAQREALYQETAHHVIDASLPVEQIVARIQEVLRLARAS